MFDTQSGIGTWITSNCSAVKPFVCSVQQEQITTVPPPTTVKQSTGSTFSPLDCPNNLTFYAPTESCYGVFYGRNWYGLTWDDAESLCQSQNGHLTSIHSAEEVAFLNNLVSKWKVSLAPWIGLSTNNWGKSWQWSDGSPVDFLSWTTNYPDYTLQSSCALIRDEKSFFNSPCNTTATVLCRYKLPFFG
jgi:hypothetical protein